jgi:hypothetical protein
MKESAHVAYDAWCEHCAGLPEWYTLPEHIQKAWRTAVALLDNVTGPNAGTKSGQGG